MQDGPPREEQPAPPSRKPAAGLARALLLLALTAILVVSGLLVLQRSGDIDGRTVARVEVPGDPEQLGAGLASLEEEIAKLRSANRRLQKRIDMFRPRGLHVVIDTGANILYLMKGDEVVRKALCSTGSGMRLSDPDNPRSWVFDTPRGEFHIRKKIANPVWTKPDWAFIEEGEDLPGDWKERIEKGVLGDYSMDLGDGYLIHGTLLERSLGLHVTHGCVRLGDADLEAVFRSVRVGTKVYII
jgi:L,D-transpeptidase YbiS